MLPAIKIRFGETQLREVQKRYGLEPRHRLLSDWHAFTFEVGQNNRHYILRVTDHTHRTAAEIDGELEWMAFVRNAGLAVPLIIPSLTGRNRELIDSGPSQFTAVLFEKLTGRTVADSDWNPALFKRWGALVGSLHHLSTQLPPTQRRAQWHQSDFLNIDAYIPDDLPTIKRSARELIAEIRALPRDSSSFGLMHADVYQNNFFISEGGLQLFDFDNSEYGFFANDIAISLYAALWRIPPGEDHQAFTTKFLHAFWSGYRTTFSLNQQQLANLPLFLRLRDLLIYIVARKKLDLTNLTPTQSSLLEARGNRISNRTPIVNTVGILQ